LDVNLKAQKKMAVEVADFDRDVLEKSRETPVLVDFWAPWCGPCRVLGPVLDKLAAESGGSWELAKLNTDENPEVSMQYGIRGIPAVKLFIDGEVTAEFTGALPEHAVRSWLNENIPSEDSASLAEATSLVGQGRVSEAQELLEHMDSDEARLLLARLIVFTDPSRAKTLLQSMNSTDAATGMVVDSVREVAEQLATDEESLPDGAGRTLFKDVLAHLKSGKFDEAVSSLVSLLQTDRYYADDAARKLGVALFTLLGPDHPVTQKHRRIFDMYLF
jgi:putative thioredoxin